MRATAADQATANTCCQRVFDTIQTQGPDLYGFGDGELSRANTALSQGQSVELSDRIYDLLRRADVWRVASGGRFDPAVGGMVAAWGFDDLTRPQTGGVPDQAAIDRMIAATTTGYTFGPPSSRNGDRRRPGARGRSRHRAGRGRSEGIFGSL